MGLANNSFINIDGEIKSCGNNSYGQLGLNDKTQRMVFTSVPDISDIKQISCGQNHTFLLMNDDTIRSCGMNKYGQLGLNHTNDLSVFTSVPDITDVKQISCGSSHTLLLMNDGTIRSCGYNYYGQLGLGNNTNISVFTPVPNITNVKQIACGMHHTLLLMNDDTIRSCGYNYQGQLGLGNSGTSTDRLLFTSVPNITGVKQISCGQYHTLLLMNDGTIRSCGYNYYGQLGLGNSGTGTDRLLFTSVPNITGVKQIACGRHHALISMNDDTIRSCGTNAQGQLGLNHTNDLSVFTSVPDITDVKQISCGYNHTILLMNDLSIKACGHNSDGQLGINSSSGRTTFITIPNINLQDSLSYLIKKQSDDEFLYSINNDNNALIVTASDINNPDFDKSITELNQLTEETQYGKPIDKLDNFSIYKSGKKPNVSLPE